MDLNKLFFSPRLDYLDLDKYLHKFHTGGERRSISVLAAASTLASAVATSGKTFLRARKLGNPSSTAGIDALSATACRVDLHDLSEDSTF